ncbi:DUF2804 domain-containing protein [Clostridium hydrogeniformans]|uniref:DUF2804 domain-containing protein n=1 Tax=Clostridium hydrogeniformans TaxID=349933 RepID=UPI00048332EA|nr:DUF2804 domain-containing protein [Clostridium hydrogeniformans]
MERIKEPRVKLCDEKGNIRFKEGTWFKDSNIECNLSKRHIFRRKKWNYWTINNDRYFFTIAITDLDYASMIFSYIIDIEENKIMEKSFVLPLSYGVNLKNSIEEDLSYNSRNLNINISYDNDKVNIDAFIKDFYEGDSLKASFTIYDVNEESLNIVVPWSHKRYAFTSKQNALSSEGSLTFKNNSIEFLKSNSFASKDFGRGVWKRNIKWNWLTCSLRSNYDNIGINLGAHWTLESGINENGIIINGKSYKIHEDVIFIYDREDLYKPWIIKSQDDIIDLKFYPKTIRHKNIDLNIIKSEFYQVFGYLKGKIIYEKKSIDIKDSLALCEEHKAKW